MSNADIHIASSIEERSGQYTIVPPKAALILLPDTSKSKASEALKELRAGNNYETDDIFVLDEILQNLTEEDKEKIIVWSGLRPLGFDLLYRVRFERGLDPRPRAKIE